MKCVNIAGFASAIAVMSSPFIPVNAEEVIIKTHRDSISGYSQAPASGNGVMVFQPSGYQTELPENLRVTFIVKKIHNEKVVGNGVTSGALMRWDVHSDTATSERYNNDVVYLLPDVSQSPNNVYINMYDGLVSGGCGTTPFYEIDFKNAITSGLDQLGSFESIDNSTIQPNGNWTFAYTVHADDDMGNLSNVHVSGVVTARCTVLENF